MQAKELLKHHLAMSDMVVNMVMTDLSDADILVRPAPKANHIAWQLGHLISTERSIMEQVKPGASPALPAGFDETHSREHDAPSSDDTSKFLKKEQYMDLYRKQREATTALLEGLSEADLEKTSPERFAKMAPKFAHVFMLAGSHFIMHTGQFSVVRRKLGKPVTF